MKASSMSHCSYSIWMLMFYILSSIVTMTTAVQNIPVPNQNGVLNDYLCGSRSSDIVDQTTLELSSTVEHVISPNQFCVFMNKEGIVIQSSGLEMAVVRCEGNGTNQSGFGFVGVSRLSITNIRFENCGGIILHNSMGYPSTVFAPPKTSPENAIRIQQQAVLLLSFCSNTYITNVTFNNYRGYAVYAINVFEDTRFQRITIKNSYAFLRGMTLSERNDLLDSGSGIYLHFIDSELTPAVTNSNVYITHNSNISNNWNVYPTYLLESLRSVRLQNQPEGFPLSGSGAVSLHLEQRRFKVKLVIDSTETRNNAGSTGGSTKIMSRNTINNFDLNITISTFIDNSIFRYSRFFRGAGIQMYFLFSYDKLHDVTTTAGVDKASIIIADSIFERNTAKVGAAMAFFCEAQNVSEVEVNLRSVQFIENEASDDGDCVAAQREQSAYYQAKELVMLLESVRVAHTGSDKNIDVDRSAALSFVNVVAKINGSNEHPSHISNGNNGALKAYSTKLFLSRDVQFVDNSALYGGAIALEANSFLFFVEPTNVFFARNKAVRGGAIYSDFTSGDRCVMQFTMLSRNYNNEFAAFNMSSLRELDFNITFIDNNAEDGNATYAQPIFNCSWYSESVVQFPTNQVEVVYDTLFTFISENQTDSFDRQMRSYPQKPCFCQESASFKDYTCLNQMRLDPIQTYPGKSFTVNLVPVDSLSHSLRSVIETRITDETLLNKIRFENNRQRDVRELNGSSCYAANYTLYNSENDTVLLKFGSRESNGQFVELEVRLVECPFGFEFDEQNGLCDCIPLYKNNKIACDIENGQFTKTDFEGGIYWIGQVQFSGFPEPAYAKRCPEGYCVRNKTLNEDLLNKTLCIGDRANEMCGQCKPGMSMKFGTTDCGSCSNYWLFTIILYVFAGIFLVFMLFLLRMTISDGTLITVIFYAQLFSINLNLLAGTNETRFATVFISLLNLELGFPICFYEGMDFAGKLGFQFVFPIYLWLIVGLLTYLCRYSNRLSALIGSECAKVFVTLFYLSYTKIVRTVFEVFVWGVIETENKNHIVWFFDGSVQFFTDWKHFLLILVSLLMFLLVISPYKFFLFLSQWCLHNPWISRHFKPLIDANLAPFKDRWRFWLGMRLFITEVMILISIIFTSINPKIVAFSHVAIVIVLMMFQAYIKPYKSKFINMLDLFFIVNFLLFVTSCVFLYVVVFKPGEVITATNPYLFTVEIIYVDSAFLVFVSILIYHAVIRVKNYQKKRSRLRSKVKQPTVSVVEISRSESISLEPTRDLQNVVIDTRSDDYVGLREPLLED